MAVVFSNNAVTTLAAGIDAAVTSVTVQDGSVFPALVGSNYTYVTFENLLGETEIVKVTAISGNTLTVVRAQDNTPARVFSSGSKCELRLTAALLNEVAAQADTDTVYTHPANHAISVITGLQTALDGKVDDSQVLTNVPANAVFTDTVYTLPAGYATETYVGTAISNLVDSSPATLDTLNELAAALGDDPNFATTVTNSIATKLPLAGGTLTGTLAMGANAITSTGTISSGAITATGNSIVLGVGSTGNAFQVFRGSDGAGAFTVMNTGEVIVSSNYFYVDASQGSYFSSSVRFRGTISNDTGTDVTIGDTLNVTEGIKLNGTTVIDSSLNLTNIGTLNGGTPWTSSNDGSGSGLDADLLDGQEGSYYAPASRTYLPTAGNYVWDGNNAASTYNIGIQTSFVEPGQNWPSYGAVLHVGARGGGDAGGDFQIYSGHGSSYGGNYLRVRNADNEASPTDSWTAWRTIWDSGNDGSGSGLDADLLDGMNATSSIVGSTVVARNGSGYIYANHINFNTSETENPAINSFLTGNGDGWSRKSSLDHVKNSIRNVADGTWGINITGSAATATDSSKLPLTGGTLSGTLSVSNGDNSYATFGPNTTWGGSLKIGAGTGGSWLTSNTAAIYSDNGNLKVDAATGANLYLNQHNGGGTIYVGGTTNILMHTGNYNSYAPTLTGGGASGTWPISVTGSSNELLSKYPYAASNWILDSTLAQTLSPGVGSTTVSMHNSHGLFGDWATTLTMSGYERYGAYQISGQYDSNPSRLAMRNYSQALSGWTPWTTILSSANYNSYSPTLTGGNASGTWPISVTGSANTVTYYTGRTDGTSYPILWGAGTGTTHAYSCAAVTLRSSDGTIFSTSLRGSGNVGGTGEATHHPAGIYSTGTNWLYGTMHLNNNSMNSVSTINGGVPIQSANYNSYAPTLTGGGASGSWGINVTGSSTSAFGLENSGGNISGIGFTSAWGARPGGNSHFAINAHTGVTLSGYPGYGGVRLYSAGYPTHSTSVLRLEASSAVYTFGGLYSDGNTVLNAANYNSYAPTLTGGGASGNWPISISGTASTLAINTNRTDSAFYQAMWTTPGSTTAYSSANSGVSIRSSAYGAIGFNNAAWYIEGNASYGLYTNTGLNAAGGLYDVGNRVYSAGNPQVNISGSSGSCTGNAATASNATNWAGLTPTRLFNNMGNNHSTYQDFNSVPGYGAYYLQGGTNGPTGVTSDQFYGFTLGLGNDYPTTYGTQIAWPRRAQNGGTYIYIRDREGTAWGAWTKIRAGVADSATSATTASSCSGNAATATTASNSNALGGYANNQTGGANTIVQRDANGYIQNSYFYTSGGGTERSASGMGYFAGFNTGDYYIRSYTNAAAASIIQSAASGSWNVTAARATRANGNFYIDDNYGNGIIGVYSSTRYQGVYSMGSAYVLPADGTTTGNLYGMAWSYPSAGGAAGNLDSHGMLVLINGGYGSSMSYSIKASGNVTAYSDERLKTNWKPMPENFVSRLSEVRVGIYDRTDGEQLTQVGVSAQSLQVLLPEAIITAKDEIGTLSVNYGGAALASTVELAKVIVEQEKRIERLERLIEKLTGESL